tara:strand:+ start:699 stop:1322 length:624 start_codon:yes stop_codon:yes gene_type:complete
MFELELAILVGIITGVLGPVLVTRYKFYLESKKLKVDPLVTSIKSSMLVNEQLDEIREELKSCRVWVSQFHNGGGFYPTGQSIQKFSICYENTKPGTTSIGEIYKNIPVSLFTKPFMSLYEDKEILIPNYTKEDKFNLSTFADGTNSKSAYLFALFSLKEEFIGTLGVEYCTRAKTLSEDQLNYVRDKSITIGTLLSTYLYNTTKNK